MELARPTFVDHIYDFNLVTGLLQKGYSDYLESSFQIEEALEGFPERNLLYLGNVIMGDSFTATTKLPREVSRAIVTAAETGDNRPYGEPITTISDVERLDKACDAVVFAIGSMAKLRLSPDQINRAMRAVTDANLQKLSMPKDAQGKLTKPANFIGPEVVLQAILDEREPEKC